MADLIDYTIQGNDMQIVEIGLDPGEGVRAEVGTMMFGNRDESSSIGDIGGSIIDGLFGGDKKY